MDEWEPIPLSRLSHAGFCLRRAALLTNEQVWAESADTAKGRSEHERVHTQRIERRGDSAKLYEFPVFSKAMGVSGKCDCIEAEASAQGCMIPALDFPVRLYPVEYKHGKLRAEQEYEVQLCAQAMVSGRNVPDTDPGGRHLLHHIAPPVSGLFYSGAPQSCKGNNRKDRGVSPKLFDPAGGIRGECKACSLREHCLPAVQRSASGYCMQLRKEAMHE